MMLVLASHKMRRSLHLPVRILKVYSGLNWVQSQSRWCQHTLLYQGYILETAPARSIRTYWYSYQQNVHSKHRGGGEEPLVAGVQIVGQLVVTSSQGPPPIDMNSVRLMQMHNPRNQRQTRAFWRFSFPKVIKQLILGAVPDSRTWIRHSDHSLIG